MMPMLSSNKSNRIGNVFRFAASRLKSVWILYAVTMFILMPLVFLIQVLTDAPISEHIPTEPLSHMLAIGMSILMPLLLFHYLNNKQAVDVFHSLPISRKRLYWGNYLFGLLAVLLPYLAFGGGSLLALSFLKNSGEPLLLFFNLIVIIICLYSCMVLIITNCGTLFESITYFAIIQIGYPVFLSVGISFLAANTLGFQNFSVTGINQILFNMSPLYQVLTFHARWETFEWWKPALLLVVTIITAVLGAVLYQKRKSESAGQSFAFRPLFYIGSLLVSITVGIGFVQLYGFSESPFFAYLLGILCGITVYFILDTIRNRGFHKVVKTAIVATSVTAVIVLFFAASNYTNTFGYETRIPQFSQVKSVSVLWESPENRSPAFLNNVKMTDEQNIKDVIKFHQGIVNNVDFLEEITPDQFTKPPVKGKGPHSLQKYTRYPFDNGAYASTIYGTTSVTMTYFLTNGTRMIRQYSALPIALTEPLYRIAQSDSYQKDTIKWLDGEGTPRYDQITLENIFWQDSINYSIPEAQQSHLKEALMHDLSARSAEMNIAPKESPLGRLILDQAASKGLKSISIAIYPDDVNLLAFLENNDYSFASPSSTLEQPVTYLSKDERKELAKHRQQDIGIFLLAGKITNYGDWLSEKGSADSDIYMPVYHRLSKEDCEKLQSMVTPIYFAEEMHDVIILNGINFLVYPQYEEEVKALIESSPLMPTK